MAEAHVAKDSLHTEQLHGLLDRLRAGDRAAADELLRTVGGRLERLVRHMLKGFPNVQRWADPGDVFQGAAMRLLRTLEAVRPESARAFLGLAAVHIRRELLDLARSFDGPRGLGATHVSSAPGSAPNPLAAAPDRGADSDELERWRQFHEAVERLPAEEREVVGLKFYHGWNEAQIAELFQVTQRTVRRWWRSAGRRLAEQLREGLPEP
jgi:RNA polymerase sigma-70 factor (ECF subfamily)